MRPRILLLAASAVACGSAHAASVVEMYGMAMPFRANAKTSGGSAAPAAADRPNQISAATYTGLNDQGRQRITVGTSHWGFRGYEDLSPTLKAVWQMESGFQIDQNTGPGIAARDSRVGRRHSQWGEIFYGQWDTPYKYISLPVNPLRAGFVFDRTAITGNPGFQVPNTTTQSGRIAAKPDASFDRRAGNSVQYWSPAFGGFTFRLDHVVNETKGAVVAGGPVIQPTMSSASVNYDTAQLILQLGFRPHHHHHGLPQLRRSAGVHTANASLHERRPQLARDLFT